MDTIFALASAPGRAGVSVIRVSGAGALDAVGGMAGPLPEVGRTLRVLRDAGGDAIDSTLILTFAKGGSFTGEAVVEIHAHGSIAVVRRILVELSGKSGLRQAEAGEFTRRALENGRMDLAQVEGLADLIDAETEAQRVQSLRVMSGALSDLAEEWRSKLLRAAALVEATIDFADEEVPTDVAPEVRALIADVRVGMARQVSGVAIAERVRDGFEVAIVGPPNAGKSTLLNRLAGRDAAITSSTAGTTRDVIEVRMDLRGLPVTILDTAGIRESADELEAMGIERGLERARLSDLRVFLGADDHGLLEPGGDDLLLRPKDDTGEFAPASVSGRTGQGVDRLVDQISDILRKRAMGSGVAIRARHGEILQQCLVFLDRAEAGLDDLQELSELVAEDLRAGIRAVDGLVGRIDVEDLLGEIFSSFCIGK